MGGAQPLAVTMNDGVCLIVDVDATARLRAPGRAPATSTTMADDRSTTAVGGAVRGAGGAAGAVGRGGRQRAPTLFPSCCAAASPIDIVTDQTSAHDPLSYLPDGRRRWTTGDDYAAQQAGGVHRPGAGSRWPGTSRRWSASWTRGAEVFDYGNSIRGEAQLGGYERAFAFPGFVPAYIRPLFCEGKGPFRWAALSGDPADIAATDRAILDAVPGQRARCSGGSAMARERVAFQGLPARICWLGYGERDKAGLRFNELVASRRAVARRS